MGGGFRDDISQDALCFGEAARLLVPGRELHQLRDPLDAGRRRLRRRCHLRRGAARRRDRADLNLGHYRPGIGGRISQLDNRDV